ncbi:MAG: hypothetical protein QOI61_1805 [Actinomycetota bacterium]
MSHPIGNFTLVELLTGGFGAGKTDALVARWRRLAGEHGSGRVAYIAASSTAAADVRRRMIAAADGLTVGPLVVTTWTGLAVDVVRHAVPALAEHTVVGGEAQRRLISELFAEELPLVAELWGANAEVARRRAFPDQLVAAVRALRTSRLGIDEIVGRADAAGAGERWRALAAFVDRYAARLEARHAIDFAGVVRAAEPALGESMRARFVALLLDDVHAVAEAHAGLLAAVLGIGVDVTATANPDAAAIDVGGGLADAHVVELVDPRPRDERLVVCRHPSMEADAVVGELVAAHEEGVAWHDMAVITPRAGLSVGRAVVRALSRRGIPVRIRLADGEAEPVVRHVRELLSAVAPDTNAVTALDDCVTVAMSELLASGDLVSPEPSLDRAIDALVAFGRGATAWADQQLPGTATVAALRAAVAERDLLDVDPVDPDGSVAVVTIEEAAGRHWQRCVLTSCVEGEYPRGRASVAWFDDAITLTAPLRDERGPFARAASRAEVVVFVSAPQPGVLISRYVEDLPAHDPRPGWAQPSNPTPKAPTVTAVPISPSGTLRLSASQLSTYENCPRRWFYGNVLRLHDSTSVWADFGNLIHDVLEKFLAPGSAVEYSLDALLDLAEEMWTDDVAQFAPQRTQARREMRDVLENWWSMEGSLFDRAQVLDVEHEFEFPVGDRVVVRGFIDRVDRDPDRGGIAVVDYKTGGRPPSEAEVEDDVQLAVYYLAALRSTELAAVGPPTRLELRYIRVVKTLTQAITPDHEARAEARILEAAAQMLDESLEPLPTGDCDHCDYHRLCPLQRAGREAGATR